MSYFFFAVEFMQYHSVDLFAVETMFLIIDMGERRKGKLFSSSPKSQIHSIAPAKSVHIQSFLFALSSYFCFCALETWPLQAFKRRLKTFYDRWIASAPMRKGKSWEKKHFDLIFLNMKPFLATCGETYNTGGYARMTGEPATSMLFINDVMPGIFKKEAFLLNSWEINKFHQLFC